MRRSEICPLNLRGRITLVPLHFLKFHLYVWKDSGAFGDVPRALEWSCVLPRPPPHFLRLLVGSLFTQLPSQVQLSRAAFLHCVGPLEQSHTPCLACFFTYPCSPGGEGPLLFLYLFFFPNEEPYTVHVAFEYKTYALRDDE